MHSVLDAEPIRPIFAVSRIYFLRSEKLHICKSNSFEVTRERRRIEVRRPEAVIPGPPIYDYFVSEFSEPFQLRRGRSKVEDDLAPCPHR